MHDKAAMVIIKYFLKLRKFKVGSIKPDMIWSLNYPKIRICHDAEK